MTNRWNIQFLKLYIFRYAKFPIILLFIKKKINVVYSVSILRKKKKKKQFLDFLFSFYTHLHDVSSQMKKGVLCCRLSSDQWDLCMTGILIAGEDLATNRSVSLAEMPLLCVFLQELLPDESFDYITTNSVLQNQTDHFI